MHERQRDFINKYSSLVFIIHFVLITIVTIITNINIAVITTTIIMIIIIIIIIIIITFISIITISCNVIESFIGCYASELLLNSFFTKLHTSFQHSSFLYQ